MIPLMSWAAALGLPLALLLVGINLAGRAPEAAGPGTGLQVDVRGRQRGAVRVTRPPFVDASPK